MYKIRDYPYLAVQDQVLFPGALCGLQIGDQYARSAVEAAAASENKTLAIFTARVAAGAGLDDLHPIGVLAAVGRVSDSSVEIEVVERVRLRDISRLPHPIAQVELMSPPKPSLGGGADELSERLRELALTIFSRSGEQGRRATGILETLESEEPLHLVEFLSSALALPSNSALEILGADTVEESQRLLLEAQNSLLAGGHRPMVRAFSWPDLDSDDEDSLESAQQLRLHLEELNLPPDVLDRVLPELEKLDRFDPNLFEHQETFARLEGLLAFPWHIHGEGLPRLDKMTRALDKAIYGHQEAKELLLDLLVALKLRPEATAPILILCGAPGLGQGALVRTLAKALDRPLEQISLPSKGAEKILSGSTRNLSEGRLGAIYEAALSAAAMDPVVHLTSEFPIDEATAREIQHLTGEDSSRRFTDRYLGLPIDVSKMLFVLEVSSLETVPEAVRERAIVLQLESYAPEDKRNILLHHLWPSALRQAGQSVKSFPLAAETVEWLVRSRTNEAGVAELYRLCRQFARRLARQRVAGVNVTTNLESARASLGQGVSTVRAGASVGVVGQSVLTLHGAEVHDSAVFQGDDLPIRIGDTTLDEAITTAWSLGRVASSRKHSWQFFAPGQLLPQERSSLALSFALALRSATLGVAVSRDLCVLGGLRLGGELTAVPEIRERTLAAWRSGYRTLVLSPEQLPILLEGLPEEVVATLKFITAATFEETAAQLFRGTSPCEQPHSESERAA